MSTTQESLANNLRERCEGEEGTDRVAVFNSYDRDILDKIRDGDYVSDYGIYTDLDWLHKKKNEEERFKPSYNFNYDFDPKTWQMYSLMQRKFRIDNTYLRNSFAEWASKNRLATPNIGPQGLHTQTPCYTPKDWPNHLNGQHYELNDISYSRHAVTWDKPPQTDMSEGGMRQSMGMGGGSGMRDRNQQLSMNMGMRGGPTDRGRPYVQQQRTQVYQRRN